MNARFVLALVAPIIVLGGCATVEDKLDDYQFLSCVELDQEIGKQKYRKEDARSDRFGANIDSIFGDKDERDEASGEILGADITEEDAETGLEALRRLKRRKGCA